MPMAEKLTLTECTNLAYSSAEYEVRELSSANNGVAGVNALLACTHKSDHVLFGLYAQKFLSLAFHARQPI